jgi:hypothetical protein
MAMSRSLGGRSLTTRSPIEIWPPEISSNPAIMRSAVDLPQPDGPTSTMNSWSSIARSSCLITATSPNRLTIPSSLTPAICLSSGLRLAQRAGGEDRGVQRAHLDP